MVEWLSSNTIEYADEKGMFKESGDARAQVHAQR